MTSLWNRFVESRAARAFVQTLVGLVSYPCLVLMNKLEISGMEHLAGLPHRDVLFVCNHQTYFADVITLYHIFYAAKAGKKNRLGPPFYLFNRVIEVYFIAAAETMHENWITRLFILAGALMIKRTWKTGDKSVQREHDPADTEKITRALAKSWVLTFPQGTTQPYAPGRKGTAYIIKASKPIVVPVVIGGFRKTFGKKGLWPKSIGARLSVAIKPPLEVDYGAPAEDILDKVMDSIEQSEKYIGTEVN